MRSFAGQRELTPALLREAPLHRPRPSALEVSLQALPGVGPKTAEAAAETGIRTLGDLLLRVPSRYRDLRLRPLAEIAPGEKGTALVEVLGSSPSPFRRGRLWMVSVKVGDASGHVRATWFNQPWVAEKLERGTTLLVTGKRSARGFAVQEWELVDVPGTAEPGDSPEPVGMHRGGGGSDSGSKTGPAGPQASEEDGLVPVHPAAEGLRRGRVREWVQAAVKFAGNAIEGLPAELRARRGLASVADALHAVHLPESQADVKAARERLAFEELFLHQSLLATRRSRRASRPAPRFGDPGDGVRRWLEALPFEPTGDQRRAFAEIDADLDRGEPMARLLMGEVGSGKTVVAVYAMLRALEAGYQAALMAPTETLAEQHAITLGRLLAAEATPFALLTGSTPAAARRRALGQLASGELGLIVGTHALIEPTVRFARLGLAVIDEQHRFGVEQRRALDAKGVEGMAPHVLHMTATPIPRTLSLAAYGDLDTIELRELPAGRQPVTTGLVAEDERPDAYEFLRRQLRRGRQAYVVCPLVSESDKLPGRAAEVEAERLRGGELRGFSLGVLHGQMPAAEKAEAMRAFAAGETDVLVATTVIEVGIDVANATVIVIEGAERFGVSQLHQLRGRVGRGEHASHCLLFAEQPGEAALKRLRAVASESDGFRLAEVDLELRGEGEILGTRQSGLPRFAVAALPEDRDLLEAAQEEVQALLNRFGSLADPALGPLLDAAHARFGPTATEPIPL